MDAGNRHETLGSEQKDGLLLTAVSRVSAFLVPVTPIPTKQQEEGHVTTAPTH